MSTNHNISPFFRRRIKHHKFEKMMREGINFIYHDTKSLNEFKRNLVQGTLDIYLQHYYDIDLKTIPSFEVSDFINYMIDVYDPLLKSYYYNARRADRSLNENIKGILKEEESGGEYLWDMTAELNKKYVNFVRKMDNPFLKESEIVSILYDKGRKIFEVNIQSDYNDDLLWWIQFDENMNMESVIKHEIKEWEYNIKDVNQIRGFEGDYKYFWSIIERIYPLAQKYIVKKRKQNITENTQNTLQKFFIKLWDNQKEKEGYAFYDEDLLKKLGLYEPIHNRHRILEYYVEYMGGKKNQIDQFIGYLESKIFNSNESEEIKERVNIEFKFKLLYVNVDSRRELKGYFYITEGSWYDQDEGETYSIITGQNEIEDMGTFFDLQYEIGEGINDFVTNISRKFGLMLNFTNIKEYEVKIKNRGY